MVDLCLNCGHRAYCHAPQGHCVPENVACREGCPVLCGTPCPCGGSNPSHPVRVETPIAPDLAAIRERAQKMLADKSLWRQIVEHGTCDGCAEEKPLRWEYAETEAWICDECFADEKAHHDLATDSLTLLDHCERLRTVINEAVAFMDRRHHYADAPMIASLRAVLRGEVRRLDQGEPSALPAPSYLGRGA